MPGQGWSRRRGNGVFACCRVLSSRVRGFGRRFRPASGVWELAFAVFGVVAGPESFVTTLLARSSFAARNQARSVVFDYIEGLYNLRRRHSAIGYHSRQDYERSPKPPC